VQFSQDQNTMAQADLLVHMQRLAISVALAQETCITALLVHVAALLPQVVEIKLQRAQRLS
jgi:hypothetical protein